MGDELESVGEVMGEESQQGTGSKGKATAVWGFEDGKEGRKGSKGFLSRMRGDKQDSSNESKARRIDNDLDNIPVIPDLEEVRDEDFTSQVAEAPNVSVIRVTAFKQLEQELLQHSALHLLDGEIDLKVLTSVLAPETEIREADCEWRWDGLFAEVSSEISSEKIAQIGTTIRRDSAN
ncbi:Intraflagellar transport protein 43-like protein isoform X2 [Oopsacas minuta]|uniref:Intraflagellar transport protein 43-like protein isoform X2 n=1 Tax=Oopsacas minuta TaxID=111878 RepID=A0AAV7KBN4_9METZ|nr:Intraflagellar transport protein 43-like protein isoform X2 [Oopsacas minuta]